MYSSLSKHGVSCDLHTGARICVKFTRELVIFHNAIFYFTSHKIRINKIRLDKISSEMQVILFSLLLCMVALRHKKIIIK
jgi:hypothetical protein